MNAVVLVLLLSVAAVCNAAPPSLPKQFEAELHLALPYANINEQIFVWYDGVNQKERIDYYGGVDSYIYRGDLNLSFQINPTGVNATQCLTNAGAVQLQSIFPDLTSFVLQPDSVTIRGVVCQNWQFVQQEDGRSNYYNFFVNSVTNQPVQYHMYGYDTLFGSHYDEYVLTYDYIIQGVNSHAFDKPSNGACNQVAADKVEEFEASNPLHEFARLNAESSPHRAQSDKHVHNIFNKFVEKHGRKYSSDRETLFRKSVFANNMRFVNAKNRQRLTYSLKLNHLADLTSNERLSRNNPMRPSSSSNGASSIHVPKHTHKQDLPPAVDWRDKGAVTAVKDQGVCGSCWSFGAAQTIEGAYFMKTGQLIVLSEQSLVDCSWPQGNNGCDGGLDYQAYQWIMSNGGIPAEADYSYMMADGYCRYDNVTNVAVVTNLAGYVNVTSGDETALMDALASVGPISISIDASHESLSFYYSGVYNDPACQNGINDLDHTVLLVGYGTDPTGGDYWIVKNSWSTHWGNEGYVWISRVNNLCGVATSPTYVELA